MVECAVIRDLLPLYADNVLSKESRTLIEGHLAACEQCRQEHRNTQSEITQLQPKEEAAIDGFKSVRKKIFRQRVLAAVMAGMVAAVLSVVGYWFVFIRKIPIEYADNARVEWNAHALNFHMGDEGITVNAVNLLTLISTHRHSGANSTSRIIPINGVDTEVIFFYFTETLAARWWSNDTARQTGETILLAGASEHASFGMDIVQYPSLPQEIYYLAGPLDKIAQMSDEDYYRQRADGVLLWSGRIWQS